MCLDNALADRQSKPGASPASAETGFKYVWQVFGGDARSVVLNLNSNFAISVASRDINHAARGGMTKGIAA
jgi:hypothetical protein